MATTELVLPTDDPTVVDYRQRAIAIRDEANALAVDDAAGKARAIDFLGRVARLKKDAEGHRVGITKPLTDFARNVNALFAEVLRPVDEGDRIARGKVLEFDQAERRRAAEAAARAEREGLEAEALLKEAERAEAAGNVGVAEGLLGTAVAREESAKVVQTQATPPARTTAAGAGAATVRRTWTFRIVDAAAIPRDYLELNEAKVRKAILAGERAIPGLEIFQADGLSVRG